MNGKIIYLERSQISPKLSREDMNRAKRLQVTAGRIILFFVHEFIYSPTKEKPPAKLLVFFGYLLEQQKEDADLKITLSEVAKLRISQVSKTSPEIDFGDDRVLETSSGLHSLLLVLCGKLKEDTRLFENIDEDMKNLQRKFTKICEELNINPQIMPSSFILTPHLYPGIRISAAEASARKKARQLIPSSAANTRKKIKEWLKSIGEQIKKTSFIPS